MSDSNLEKILIIDDNSDYRKLINTFISKLLPGTEVIELDPVFEGVPDDNFNWSDIDVLLLDYHLSIVGTTGLDILHKHHKKNTFPATIMLTGAGTEEIAVRALKTGIYEYLPKQSLTKDKLKQSVIHAWEAKKAERKKKQELTQHNRSFSKEVFYENLERASDPNLPERALIIIKPDDLDLIEEQIGVIGKDRLINYIAKNSYDTFKLGACNPNITKISDTQIGIQIDYPINLETLSFNMQGLCDHLAKSTFKFAEEKYVFSVSMGILKLGLFNKTAEQLIYIASTACDNASSSTGNSFYIWQDSDPLPEFIEQSQNDVIAGKTLSTEGNEEKPETILKAKEEVEARIKAAEEEREKLEAELRAKEKAEKAQANLKAEQKAKEKVETEARIKAAEEEKEKLQAQLKAKEEAEKAQVALKAEQEAKEKAEAKILAIEEEKKKLQAELKAREEAEKAQAALQAEREAKEKAEAEAKIKAAEEERKKLEATLKAKEEQAKVQAALQAEQEAKEKAEAEAKIKAVKEAKEKAEAEAKIKAAEEERKKLQAELIAKEQAEKTQAALQAEQEAKEKAEAEAKIKTAEEEKKRLEVELKAREEQAKAQAALRAEQEAEEKAEAQAKIKAAEEEKEKLEAELIAKEQAEKVQAAHAEQEAREKAEAQAKIKAAEEEKEKLEAELKAREEQARAQAALRAEQEAKEKAEAETKIKVAEEEKEKLQAQLKAKEEAEKTQIALRAEQEAKEKAEAEAKIKAAEEEKEKLQAQLKAKEEAEKTQIALRAEQEEKEKAEAEAKMNAAQQEKEKLEAELKAIAKAKEEAEAEMQAAREEKEKLEAELKAMTEAKTKQKTEQKIQADTPLEKPVDSKEVSPEITETKETENTNAAQEEVQNQADEKATSETKQESETEKNSESSIEEIEAKINKLIGENKIIQTYQPITAMFEDEGDPREIYKTGLQALSENDTLNEYLADTSVFSLALQQAINEWALRQIFLRITESGTSDCQYLFLISATESWFSDIALFQWLQKILQQTKKYSPGKSIILDVPLDLFIKHQKRAQALIDTLRKTHGFTVSLSNLNTIENLSEYCSLTVSKLLIVNTEQLQKLSEVLAPNSIEKNESDNEEEQEEKQNLLQYIKSKNIKIITSGIEDSTLLTNAITVGTDYTLGDFVGEIQESLTESSMVESFELT